MTNVKAGSKRSHTMNGQVPQTMLINSSKQKSAQSAQYCLTVNSEIKLKWYENHPHSISPSEIKQITNAEVKRELLVK